MGAVVGRSEEKQDVENKRKSRRRIVKPAAEAERDRLCNLQQEEKVELFDPTKLRPHPRNEAIYADEPDEALLKDIQDKGIREPLICNVDTHTVISGRRRHKAALLFQFPLVPVIWREFEDDQDELEAIVMFNAYRKKNERQVMLEVEAIWSIEQTRSLALQEKGRKVGVEKKKEYEKAKKEAEERGRSFIAKKPKKTRGRRTDEVVGQALGQPKTKVNRAASIIKAAKERLGNDWQQDVLVQAVFSKKMSINSAALKLQRDKKEEKISDTAEEIEEVDADIRHQDNIENIASESIDHIITDPEFDAPTGYGSMVHEDVGICDVFEGWQSDLLLDELSGWAHEWARVIKTGGNIAVFCDERYMSFVRDVLISNGFCQVRTVAWHKTNPNSNASKANFLESMSYIVTACMAEDGNRNAFRWLGIKRMHNFIEGSDALGRGGLKHLGQLPDYVVTWLVERLTNPGDLVLDNFAGTGTTGVVCTTLKRNFTLVERDDKCVKAIKVRLSKVG